MQADVYEKLNRCFGLYGGDPRIIKDPKPISTISYMELRELSYMGALFARGSHISRPCGKLPINIKEYQ
jgi:aspartate kinase